MNNVIGNVYVCTGYSVKCVSYCVTAAPTTWSSYVELNIHKTVEGHAWHQSTWNNQDRNQSLPALAQHQTFSSVGIPIVAHRAISAADQG